MTLRAATISILLPALAGCITIDQDRPAILRVETEPPGATAIGPTGAACSTPCELLLPIVVSQTILVDKPGFVPVEVPISLRVSGGTRLFLGLIYIVHGGLRLEPNPVRLVLEPLPAPPDEVDGHAIVTTLL